MVKIEDMTNGNLKNETGNTEDIKNPELENKSPEDLGEVRKEVLEEGRVEVEEINDGAQEIDDTLQEAGDGPEVAEVGEENREVVNESKDAKDSLTERTNEVITEQNPKSENDIRIEKWENEDPNNRKEEIKNYKEGLEKEKENLLAGKENIGERIEELREETVKFAEKEAEAAMKVQESLSGVDTSKLEGLEQGEARKMIKELAKSAKNNLDIAKLDYLLRPEADLMDTHKDKEITIENLKEMADDLEKLDAYLEKFEGLSKEMKEEAREEARAFAKWLENFLKKHPEALYLIAAAGIFKGLELLLSAVGEEIPAWLTKELLIGAAPYVGAGIVLGAGAWYFRKKERREELKEMGKVGAGSMIGIGALAIGWMFNKEKIEKFIKGASKADYPDWYKFFIELFGLKEDEKSKS